MAVRIEDAGFEIRDQIMWIYGSGFPKSMNIGKAVDKKLGNEREVVGLHERQNYKKGGAGFRQLGDDELKTDYYVDKGNSEWEGWGTALKPAHEPIVMARKPFKKTVVDNVLEWGTGGINIDDSRIGTDETLSIGSGKVGYGSNKGEQHSKGRFPANVIFDEEAGKILDEQSGISKSTGGRSGNKEGIWGGRYNGEVRDENPGIGDVGGASRFFYCPKTSKKDRNEGIGERNTHPTVKPTDLMLYLIRMVTPKDGTILDPFMGSGSTGKAAIRGRFDFIGIEREKEYFEIAEARIKHEQNKINYTLL